MILRFALKYFALLLSIGFLISGCVADQINQAIILTPNNNHYVKSPLPVSIAVDEFIDIRPRMGTSDARTWIGFIPGVLWLNLSTEIPDSHTVATDYNAGAFGEAFALAFYEVIRKSAIFRDSYYLPVDRYVNYDYRLEGVVGRTHLTETVYYYGSGLYAWISRIIGMPYVSYYFEIEVELRLRRKRDNKIVWNYKVKEKSEDRMNSIYRLTNGVEGQNVISYNYSRMLKKHIHEILKGLANAAR